MLLINPILLLTWYSIKLLTYNFLLKWSNSFTWNSKITIRKIKCYEKFCKPWDFYKKTFCGDFLKILWDCFNERMVQMCHYFSSSDNFDNVKVS